MQTISKDTAIAVLKQDAENIRNLIKVQTPALCVAQCKAFEEVLDTHMFGFSREILYATKLGILSNEEGQEMMNDLEKELNSIYEEIYEAQKERRNA